VLHCITYHSAHMGLPPESWESQMFALAGDVMGEQLPQTLIWPVCILEPLSHAGSEGLEVGQANHSTHGYRHYNISAHGCQECAGQRS
jgi:hypothetical protein